MSAAESALQQGIRRLYSDHHGWLHGYLRKKCGNAFDAADLAHDTFMRVLTAWDKDRAVDLREPRAYLTTIATHVLLNHYRRLSLERAYLASLAVLPETQAPSSEDRLIILETLHEIDAVLDRLPSNARTAFLLAQLEGLTYAQIATHLHISVRTVKRYMVAAYEECILLIP
jgi:RNA polymerase sigma-70 factor (ECF subfamily)